MGMNANRFIKQGCRYRTFFLLIFVVNVKTPFSLHFYLRKAYCRQSKYL